MSHKNLEKAKKLAIIFLYMDVEGTELAPIVVMHPFLESAFLCDDEGGVFNVLEDVKKFKKWQEKMKDRIEQCDTVEKIVWLIRKSYRLTFISFLF